MLNSLRRTVLVAGMCMSAGLSAETLHYHQDSEGPRTRPDLHRYYQDADRTTPSRIRVVVRKMDTPKPKAVECPAPVGNLAPRGPVREK